MNKPVVLFFARGYQADFFPTLESERYQSIFATLTKAERLRVERLGGRVVGCFEEDYESLPTASVAEDNLRTSFTSDRFLGRYPYSKRLEILGKEVAFWAGILDKYMPIAVINELVAIEISEVLLIQCGPRKIRYLAGMNCLVDDYFYWLGNPLSLSGKYLQDTVAKDASVQHAKKYVQELLAKDYKPFYVKNLSSRRSLVPLMVACAKLVTWNARRAASVAFNSFRYEMYDDEYLKRVVVYFKSLFYSYDEFGDIPSGKEIIYYPLHQEPEATLNYMSEFYSNQVATIENILKCLHVNQVLVVKEHPVDKGSLLRQKFWLMRRRYSGLYYFPAELHGRELLGRAHRVVTLTSTVGWEAAVSGKPVYVLGQIFYDQLKGVTAVHSFMELKECLRAPPPATKLDLSTVENFVARMVEQCYRGNPFPHTDLYSVENRKCVVDAIARAMDP
jgi:hypothetical protein